MTDQGRPRSATLASGVEPGPLTDAERREFFNRPLLARLATVRPDGAPYVVPLWFEWNEADGSFWFVIRERARFAPNLLREPRVCLSIAADSPPYVRATIMGRAVMDCPMVAFWVSTAAATSFTSTVSPWEPTGRAMFSFDS